MRFRLVWWFLFTCLLPVTLPAQQRPLATERVSTVGRGAVRLELGFEFLQGAVFPLSGLEGDLSRIGVLGIRAGAGEKVEIQILGTIQNFLNVNRRFDAPNSGVLDFQGNSTSDFGDFTLATKVAFTEPGAGSPGIGFRFGFEMPNASNESGLGVDETNVFGSLLIEQPVGRLTLLGNAGIAILGDPLQNSSQDDLFIYGAAATLDASQRLQLLAEIHGRRGPGGIGTEDQTHVRAGIRLEAGGAYWDIAGFWGIEDTDPASGLIIGVSKSFDVF